MALIHFGLEQQRFTGGLTELELEAPNVQQLIAKLEARFPGIGPLLESSAVAINGEVINDAAYEPIPSGAEVYFVVKAAGGTVASAASHSF
jgi:molybdopterin converting factor small subunit